MRGWFVGVGLAVIGVAAAAVVLVVIVLSAGSGTALDDLEVGDCFDLPDVADADADADAGGEAAGPVEIVQTVDVVPCVDPHDAEVVVVGALDPDGDRPYPSDAELFAEIDPLCARAEVPGDRYGVVPIAPTESSWTSFDGRFLCIALPYGGEPSTGSIHAG